MIHRPGLGGQVLKRVHALDSAPTVVEHGDVSLDPRQGGKLGMRGTARQQDHLVPLP
jgi:hypothetical protein